MQLLHHCPPGQAAAPGCSGESCSTFESGFKFIFFQVNLEVMQSKKKSGIFFFVYCATIKTFLVKAVMRFVNPSSSDLNLGLLNILDAPLPPDAVRPPRPPGPLVRVLGYDATTHQHPPV